MELVLQNLTKRFGDILAVRDVCLTVPDGQLLVLLGPSGCGKTTTLRMVAGLESVDEGSILFDGMEVNNIEPGKRDIAMIFQSFALYPHKTVYENIAFNLRIKGLPKDVIDRKVKDAAKLLQISELLNRKPRELSGGQQRRVGVGRAIVRDPKLFLMDEPLSNLDVQLREQMRVELKHVQQQFNATTIYVTHDQREALLLADRVAVMNWGALQQVGTPLEVYDYPANIFTALFIGIPKMNLIRGRLIACDGNVAFVVPTSGNGCADFQLTLPEDLKGVLEAKGISLPASVILGFRPETATVCLMPAGADSLPLTVDFTESLGSDNLLVLTSPQLENISLNLREYIVRTPPTQNYPAGTQVYLQLTPTKVQLFDERSEQALYCMGRPMN